MPNACCPAQLQVSLQHMPDIKLNHALLSTLTDAQRESWVNSTPGNEVFRLNKATQQVGMSCHPDNCW